VGSNAEDMDITKSV